MSCWCHMFVFINYGLKTYIDKCLWVSKSNGAASLWRCFWTMDRELNIDGIKLLNEKITCPALAVRLIAGKWSSTQWRSVRTPANFNKVEDLALSQENKLQKQFTMKSFVTNSHLFGLVITVIILRVLIFHQMSFFNGKTHNLQTPKYDVSMTSVVTTNT